MKKIVIFLFAWLLLFNTVSYSRDASKGSFIKEINVLFLKENYSRLIEESDRNAKRHRLTRDEKKEVLYLTGISYVKLLDFNKARESFRGILDMKGTKFREKAYIGIADLYFYSKDYRRAIEAYESALNAYPKSDRASGIYYNLGLSYKNENEESKANYCFKKVKKDFGSSFESDEDLPSPANQNIRYYVVQLGAFSDMRNARKLVKRLSRKGYDSYIQRVKKDGKTMYRVRGGKFSNKDYAQRLVRKLKRSRFSAKIIVE